MDPDTLFSFGGAEEPKIYRLPARTAVIADIEGVRRFDVLIVGGGIHGAAFARLAAFNGLKTALLERDDYAAGTSSRSSKMAHGGLRYLENFDLRQVLEGIHAREELFDVAHHLVKPARFLIPVPAGRRWFKFRMGIGLHLYDLLVRRGERKHRWIAGEELAGGPFEAKAPTLAGCYSYTDGILNDSRLVLENIQAARQEGALCLNHASVDSLHQRDDGAVEVGWTDILTGEKHSALTGIVVNCAGPWVPFVGRLTPAEGMPRVKYSQGIHLLFKRPWRGPSLFLPLENRSQYYFVWPHFAGTMVGTTERDISGLDRDPEPTESEVDEVLSRLARDLPESGLDRSSLHYCFAGVRTLPVRGKGGASSLRLSRRHIWGYSQGVLSLYGGKYTTHAWTVQEGLKRVFKLAGLDRTPDPLKGRLLPGAGGYDGAVEQFRAAAGARGTPEAVVERAVARLGSRVRYIAERPSGFELIGGKLLRGEVDIALEIEQAESLEDLVRRRLDLEYEPGNGLDLLPELVCLLKESRPGLNVEAECARFKERIARLHRIMRIQPACNDA